MDAKLQICNISSNRATEKRESEKSSWHEYDGSKQYGYQTGRLFHQVQFPANN